MTETQKDFERIDNERFELIRIGCPWRLNPKILADRTFCIASTEECEPERCGPLHIVKQMMG